MLSVANSAGARTDLESVICRFFHSEFGHSSGYTIQFQVANNKSVLELIRFFSFQNKSGTDPNKKTTIWQNSLWKKRQSTFKFQSKKKLERNSKNNIFESDSNPSDRNQDEQKRQ